MSRWCRPLSRPEDRNEWRFVCGANWSASQDHGVHEAHHHGVGHGCLERRASNCRADRRAATVLDLGDPAMAARAGLLRDRDPTMGLPPVHDVAGKRPGPKATNARVEINGANAATSTRRALGAEAYSLHHPCRASCAAPAVQSANARACRCRAAALGFSGGTGQPSHPSKGKVCARAGACAQRKMRSELNCR
jgi:hypothetical protein